MAEEAFKPTGAVALLAYIREKYGSVPNFCDAHDLERIKVQRALNGEIQRIDVDFAFDIETATDGAVLAESWCSPESVREERRLRRSRAGTQYGASGGPDPEAA